MGLGANPFTYIMSVGKTCEYDLHKSRWDHGEQFRLFVPR